MTVANDNDRPPDLLVWKFQRLMDVPEARQAIGLYHRVVETRMVDAILAAKGPCGVPEVVPIEMK